MMYRFKWSKAFYGVQHMSLSTKRFQITICDYGSFTEAKIFNKDVAGFTPVREETFPTVKEAKSWAEQNALSFGIALVEKTNDVFVPIYEV